MTQPNIVVASVLKPLKDPRAYYRFAHSLRETNKYLINIIGFSTKKESNEKNIKFYSIFSQKRNHFSRITAGWSFLKNIIPIKPKLVIITTFELLPAAVLGKMFLKYALVYDVQENHLMNLSQNKTISGWRKNLSKVLVYFIESCSKPFIDHYFFAEKAYQDEFPTIHNHTILQNKYFGDAAVVKPVDLLSKDKLRFLISGTLTEVYGILEGVAWFKSIKESSPKATLTVIGHVPMHGFHQKLIESTADQSSIHLYASANPVPYDAILKAYEEADIVLLPFHQIPSISPKIPSKMYESIALGKPCLFQSNPRWEALCGSYPAGKGIDFNDLNQSQKHLKDFLNSSFFVRQPGREVMWKSDETKFLEVVGKLANKF